MPDADVTVVVNDIRSALPCMSALELRQIIRALESFGDPTMFEIPLEAIGHATWSGYERNR